MSTIASSTRRHDPRGGLQRWGAFPAGVWLMFPLLLLKWLSMAGGVVAAGAANLEAARVTAKTEITAGDLMRHVRTLASDEFEGRAPGSPGEERTVNYLVNEFRRMKLQPGNPDGSFIQNVPLMGVTGQPTVEIMAQGRTVPLAMPLDCIANSFRFLPEVKIENSDMVFVGYGIVAPEYGWDDFKGVDVRGKTVVMLVNDPPVPDPADPSRLDEKVFKGRAMTYYGRWTYKYEIAAEKGAAAALIIHETGPAGYPYFVLIGSNTRENFDLQAADKNMSRVPVQGWLSQGKAEELLAACGKNFAELKSAAARRDFRPVPLPATASYRIQNQLRPIESRNVVAKLEGSDPVLRNEYVVLTAHWDHIGRNPKLEGDQIYNGALDNATGTAGLLELAEAFSRLKVAPRRTLIFLAVTAEEKGLLGAKYHAERPLYPLERTLANINMDGLNPWGRTRDIEVIGYGQSTLEDLLRDAAVAAGRGVTADSGPEKGRFYRSDHFEFAKLGVPGLYLKGGTNVLGQAPGYGRQKIDEYTERDYHKVSDEVKPDWDLSGGAEDVRLLFEVAWQVAQGDRYPSWKDGSEFKARRDAMMLKAKSSPSR
jgi:Zn-dependent M28 family amino/carboxypeptidase